MKENQVTDTLLMVRPANFGFNPETAGNNAFQKKARILTTEEVSQRAIEEFDNMIQTLREHGVSVIVAQDSPTPVKTDAVFPNNWFSTHANGEFFLYPMYSPNRRLERSYDIIDELRKTYVIQVNDQLLASESKDLFLEGTGSMILDRENKIIYACYSERTHPELLEEYGREVGYEVLGFDAVDDAGVPYYHTNVIMTLTEHLAVICTSSIVDSKQRSKVLAKLDETQKKVIEISRDQVLAFAGNMLEVKGKYNKNLLVMSKSAYDCLTEGQKDIIKNHNKIVHLNLEVIEHIGGGSARCMMAEIFLPKIG